MRNSFVLAFKYPNVPNHSSLFRTMKNTVKSGKEDVDADADADASSSFSHLPGEIILKILNKLIDLKTLCRCYLVSKRFSSIVFKVDAISYTAPPLIPNDNNVGKLNEFPLSLPFPPQLFSFYGESFPSAIRFLIKFKELKSLCIELPSSREIGINTNCLFKWKVQVGKKIESFSFLAFNSICDEYGFHIDGIRDEEENGYLYLQKYSTWFQCLKDVMVRHRMLLYLIKDLPMLEEVSITDRDRRGRLSMSGEKLSEVKEWLHSSASETVFNSVEAPGVERQWSIYLLNLQGSGCVIKGVYCVVMEIDDVQDGNDGVMNSDNGFEGKEGAVFTEALKAILARQS